MCSEAEDLRHRAGWDGAAGTSRQHLLSNLHSTSMFSCSNFGDLTRHEGYIPSSIMIPQRRIATLLRQALSYQRQRCVYHNSNSTNFSLYMDHQCDKDAFPRTTTTILQVHDDEVWNLEWSHDGQYLASGSKDKTAIIWKVGVRHAPEGMFVLLERKLILFCLSACFFASPSGMESAPYIARAPICGWVPSVVSGRLYPSHKCRTNHQTLEHKGELIDAYIAPGLSS